MNPQRNQIAWCRISCNRMKFHAVATEKCVSQCWIRCCDREAKLRLMLITENIERWETMRTPKNNNYYRLLKAAIINTFFPLIARYFRLIGSNSHCKRVSSFIFRLLFVCTKQSNAIVFFIFRNCMLFGFSHWLKDYIHIDGLLLSCKCPKKINAILPTDNHLSKCHVFKLCNRNQLL